MSINLENIPQELKDMPNWVNWKFETRDGRKTKMPYNPRTGERAKANDPATWAAYEEAAQSLDRYDGIGFQLSNSPFVGIDMDRVLTNGQASPQAQEIIEQFDTYTEISPSGSGIHCIVRADIMGKGYRNDLLELYPQGRYFTVTGNVYQGHTRIAERTNAVRALIQSIEAERNGLKQGQAASQPPTEEQAASPLPAGLSMEPTAIIERIRRSKQAEKFSRLFDDGDISGYESQSSADQALMNLLLFWTWGQEKLTLEVFSQSALAQRGKWRNRPDYQKRTWEAARASWNGKCYAPQAMQAPEGESSELDRIIKSLDFPIVKLKTNKQGDTTALPLAGHWENTAYFLKRLSIRVRLNQLTKNIEFSGGGLDSMTMDSAATSLRSTFHQGGLRISRQDMYDNLCLIAEKNQYSPVCEYLTDCLKNWDGQDHIDDLFSLFELDETSQQAPELCKLLLRHWLISCVVMAFNDGNESADGVLILVGPQGAGKTRFTYTLVPVPEWAADGLTLDPTNKDDKLTAMKFWIVELGEFGDTMRKERIDRLKAYLTQRTDSIRPPYKRAAESIPRRTVFLATTNSEQFLKDNTGDRRYWPISVKHVNNDTDLDISQLWGQVMHLAFHEKESPHLSTEEIQKLAQHNRPYKALTSEAQLLLDMLDWNAPIDQWHWTTASDLCELFNLRQNRNRSMGRALRCIAEQDKRVKIPKDNSHKQYFVPGRKCDMPACTDSIFE